MTVALLIALTATCWSGLELIAAEGRGPLAAVSTNPVQAAYANGDERAHGQGQDGDDVWEDIHEALAEFCMLLVLIHIAGVIVASVLHRENLVRAMVTGRKRLPPPAN